MDWQRWAAMAVVALTVGAFVWHWWPRRRFDFHRRTGCGCAATTQPPRVIVQGRRGERPRITFKTP
ncbi:MAG TPA: hypothetical protein DCE44_04055 [Verrucomicrobiales bacterium]|nr:hypothetical protein [Verrucomicrobiales bacterium]